MIDNRKFNKILTAILILVIIAIIVALGFVGYDYFQKYYIDKGADDAISEFDNQIAQISGNDSIEEVTEDNNVETTQQTTESTKSDKSTQSKGSSSSKRKIALKYKGFDVAGKIEIPKIKVSYPVLTVATLSSMKISVGIVYGPGLNQVRKYRNNGT